MKIYLGCGLTHVPRPMFSEYVRFLHQLAAGLHDLPAIRTVKYALVSSDPQLAERASDDRAALCYKWDRQMVEEADLFVADASFPSTGLGIEMQIAETAGKPTILLIGDHHINRVASAQYRNPDLSEHDLQVGEGIVSLMALGLPNIQKIVSYTSFEVGVAEAVETVRLFTTRDMMQSAQLPDRQCGKLDHQPNI